MKPNINRLQTLLSMVKNITTRPSRSEDLEREPWELAAGRMEQLELRFDSGPPYGRSENPRDNAAG